MSLPGVRLEALGEQQKLLVVILDELLKALQDFLVNLLMVLICIAANGNHLTKPLYFPQVQIAPMADVFLLPTLPPPLDAFSAPREKSAKLFEAGMEFISTASDSSVISGINNRRSFTTSGRFHFIKAGSG